MVLVKRLLQPVDAAVRRLRQHALCQVERVAVVGVDHEDRLFARGGAHRTDHRNIAARPLLHRHMAGAPPRLDLKGAMTAGQPRARLRRQQLGCLLVARQVQIVHIERRVVAGYAQRLRRRLAGHRRGQAIDRLACALRHQVPQREVEELARRRRAVLRVEQRIQRLAQHIQNLLLGGAAEAEPACAVVRGDARQRDAHALPVHAQPRVAAGQARSPSLQFGPLDR